MIDLGVVRARHQPSLVAADKCRCGQYRANCDAARLLELLTPERFAEGLSGLATDAGEIVGWMAQFDDGGVSRVPTEMLAAALLAALTKETK